MTGLFEGALDYAAFLKTLPPQAEGSLEWFGEASFSVLPTDLFRLRSATAGRRGAGALHAAR